MSDSHNPEMSKTQSKLSSNWSLGWGSQGSKTQDAILSPRIKKYHNESQVHLKEQQTWGEQKQKLKDQKRRQNQQKFNEKLPNYDPRNGGKSSIHLGDDKVDYRNKNQFYGVRQVEKKNHHTTSQIQFG